MSNEIKGSEIIQEGYLDRAISDTKKYIDVLDTADKLLIDISEKTKISKGDFSAKKIQDTTKAYEASNKAKEKALEIDREKIKADIDLQKLEKEKINTQKETARLSGIEIANKQKEQRLSVAELKEKERLEKQQIRLNKLTEKENSLYFQKSKKLNELRKKYKDVALELGENSKQAKNLLNQITPLDKQLKKIDVSVGQNQRSVGNYKTALKGLASQIGLTFGIAGAFRFVRESVTVLADFEASIQTLAGVFRTTRDKLAPVEAEIRKVGASSVRTSLQTSILAESLATLGKTKKEIVSLLQPVTNLSIGLQASSADAGEFLVQTLNAFGAGSDEAEKYADVIASIRTSTSLDFQKMRDSFQYITPISKLLNKDLAYTGSLVGILADNGLKAESAGRLLGTAIQKLATQNITLEEALEKINKAREKGIEGTELMALATEMLGVQSAKIGIILADNSEILETNAQAIRDNTGALDDLVNSQLNSFTAQLSILKSAFQDYLLELDETYNITENLTKVVKFLSENLSSIFRVVKVAVVAFTSFKAVIILMNAITLVLNTTIKGVTVSIKGMNAAMKRNVIGVVITLIATLVATFLEYTNEVDENTKAIEANRKEQEKLNAELREQQRILDEIEFKSEAGISLNNNTTESLKKLAEQYKVNIRETESLVKIYGANDEQLKQTGKSFDDYYVSLIKGTALNSEGEQALIRRAKALRNLDNIEKEIARRGAGNSSKVVTNKTVQKSGISQLDKDIIANEEENRRIREEKIKASNLRIDRIEQEAYDKELQRQNDLAENEAENQRIKEENAKKELERLKKQKEESIKLAKDVSNFIAQETDERIRLRQTEIQQGQDKINALIATGTANSAEAIAAEEKAIARKSVEIEELERKKKNLLLSVVALERASQLIGQGDSQPLVNSGKGIEKLLSGLPKFFKGTDKTVGDELNKVTNTGKDDYLALVDKNEMIFTGQKVDSMAKVGLNSTDQITASAIAYQTQGTANRAMRSSVQSAMTDARIVSKLESLEKAIIDKPVANTTMLDPAFQRAFLLSKGKIETLNYDNTPQI